MALGIGTAIAGLAGPILGQAFGKMNDDRQLAQQEKLTALGIKSGKEMADYNKNLQMEMWDKTNYKAQVEQLNKAGMNPALLYGGGGGGGATMGNPGASVQGGGNASGSAERTQATTGATGMALQLQSQLALQKAQKENIEADTKNKQAGAEGTEAGTIGKKIENEIAGETKGAQIQKIQEDANKALAEAVISQQKQVINEETMKDQIRSIQEGTIKQILENEGVSLENKKKEAEVAIKNFEASLAKQGIASNTPWYVKMLAELLGKFGLNPLK